VFAIVPGIISIIAPPPIVVPVPLDVLTGTPEADWFDLEPPELGTLMPPASPDSFLQSLDDDFIRMAISTIVDLSEDNEVDLLVYQVADGPEYFPGFTDPLASSYILIENFDPVEDQIFVDGGKGYVRIMSDENDIPMLTDDIQPSFVYDPFNPIFGFGE